MTTSCLPRAEVPEQVGLSSERLTRLADFIVKEVEQEVIPGATLAIARGGRLACAQAFGFQDAASETPMRLDSIFRIASMTKPVVSVAAMMLAEEGRLDIGAPVADYIPLFENLTVGAERRKATRTMTVQDLLRHTSGLTYAAFGDSPVQMIWRDANLMDENQTNEELVGKLAKLPLMFEPGTTWEYSMSTDVLGRVVEVVSGQSLGGFIAERITGPLGMIDTAFAATGEKAKRVAEPLADKTTGKKPPMRDPAKEPRWQSGGGGLAGTAPDYIRFCQMLLNGGELDGVRILAPKSVALMAADHLPPGCEYGETARSRFGQLAPVPEMGYGFGLGFCVRKAQGMSPAPGSVGEFFWGGVLGTYFWIDPQEQMVTVLMMQAPDQRLRYRTMIRRLVYAAMTGPARGRRR
ncbi:MAG TPA: serine hydrolase domain-containing protein, partial [Stellaceae bacterium]|nr:serine hydrolase domain-containing protein [Stellaceae bacterium]